MEMTKFGRLKVMESAGAASMDEIHGFSRSGPSIFIASEDGGRLIATMRDFAFDGGDPTLIRAEAHRLVECWNKMLPATPKD